MTKGIRDGLALLCFAAIALVISVTAGTGEDERSLVADAARGIGVVLGLIGLGVIGYGLARRTD